MVLILENRAVSRSNTETSYGTLGGPLADLDTRYIENLQVNAGREAIERLGLTEGAPGWPSAPGMDDPSFSFDFELSGLSLDVGNAATPVAARPLWHPWMIMCGFEAELGTANQLTYDRARAAHGSVGAEFYRRRPDGAGGQLWTGAGMMADAVIKWSRGARLMVSTNGAPQSFSPADDVTSLSPVYLDEGYVATILSPASRLPMRGVGLTASIIADLQTYPSNSVNGAVLDFECRLNNQIEKPRRGEGSGSIQRIIMVPGTPEIDFSLAACDFATWDPYAIRDARTPVVLDLGFTAIDSPTGTMDTLKLLATCYVEDIEPRWENKRLVWKHKCKAGWAIPGTPGPLFSIRLDSV